MGETYLIIILQTWWKEKQKEMEADELPRKTALN